MTNDEISHFLRAEGRLQDHYFSIDVETDGPIPGDFSMLSIGIVEAGIHDGQRYRPSDTGDEFYAEIAPLEDAKVDEEALSVNGLDRRLLVENGEPPEIVMARAAGWITTRSSFRRPVMVGSPAVFDWMFVHWYFVKFLGSSPFGYSSAIDLKTMIAVKTNLPIAQASAKHLPNWLAGTAPRTHNAVDDARNQAQTFSNVSEWRGVAANQEIDGLFYERI